MLADSKINCRRSSLCESVLSGKPPCSKAFASRGRRGSIAEELYATVDENYNSPKLSSLRSSMDSNFFTVNTNSNDTDLSIAGTNSSEIYSHRIPFSPKFRPTGIFNFTKKIIKSVLKPSIEKQVNRLSIDQVREVLSLTKMDYPEKFEPKESILGHGSFGKVYLVQRTHDKKKFAIKKVPMISEDGADNYQKFVKEAIISSMIEDIKHSSTLDITVIGNDYALIMNYYPLTLARLVYEGKASIGQLNHHYRQLVSVVNYLHENGVAHRDLKLENICLDLNGGIKVIDFGNAVLFNAPGPALCIDVCGTDQYIAPEVLQSKVYDAKLCDTWSLGIIYLVMVTLKLPWPLACITQSSFTDYVRDREMFIKRYIDWPSSNLSKNIVLSMLNPDPSKRITTDALLEEDFFLDRYL